MKKFLAVLAVLALNALPASAHETVTVSQMTNVLIHNFVSQIQPLDLINWKVGDTADSQVSAGMFGNIGTMKKYVAKEEGTTGLWVNQDMSLAGQQQKVEMLINKADGKILKLKVNGQDQAIPDDKMEIISQEYVDVTVPAGTFKSIHITAKTKDVSKMEIWANPKAVPMDGGIKMITSGGQLPFDMTIELTSFSRGH